MAAPIANDPVPLYMDEHGTVRVGGTRVTLETVVGAYLDGASAEEIAEMYDTLSLGDIYSAIGYYLRHMDTVHEYIREGEAVAAEVRARIEQRPNQIGLRDRLLSRLDKQQ